ncbi:MAG: hypothetical protein ACE5ID_04550 [Acidobacteriota bacterium]
MRGASCETSYSKAANSSSKDSDYDVTVVAGDSSFPQGPHLVLVQGVSAINESTAAGQFVQATVRVPVRNGILELRVGGSAGFTLINSLDAVQVAGAPKPLISMNFQPASSLVPEGYKQDSGALFDPIRGFGWTSSVPAVERGRQVPQARDTFVYSAPLRTWNMDLPNGAYQVWVTVGDAAFTQGPQRVLVEGISLVNGETTAAGVFLEKTAMVQVMDGNLTMEMGGAGGITILDQLVVAAAPAP